MLSNPVVWIILLVAVLCYYNLLSGLLSERHDRDTALRTLQLDNTQSLLSSLPLLGLLGTIMGLLHTFAAMAMGVGNQAELMSAGIADAMFTTEVGLLLVIPGWLLLYQQRRALHATAVGKMRITAQGEK